jgi:hypothetical protein
MSRDAAVCAKSNGRKPQAVIAPMETIPAEASSVSHRPHWIVREGALRKKLRRYRNLQLCSLAFVAVFVGEQVALAGPLAKDFGGNSTVSPMILAETSNQGQEAEACWSHVTKIIKLFDDHSYVANTESIFEIKMKRYEERNLIDYITVVPIDFGADRCGGWAVHVSTMNPNPLKVFDWKEGDSNYIFVFAIPEENMKYFPPKKCISIKIASDFLEKSGWNWTRKIVDFGNPYPDTEDIFMKDGYVVNLWRYFFRDIRDRTDVIYADQDIVDCIKRIDVYPAPSR